MLVYQEVRTLATLCILTLIFYDLVKTQSRQKYFKVKRLEKMPTKNEIPKPMVDHRCPVVDSSASQRPQCSHSEVCQFAVAADNDSPADSKTVAPTLESKPFSVRVQSKSVRTTPLQSRQNQVVITESFACKIIAEGPLFDYLLPCLITWKSSLTRGSLQKAQKYLAPEQTPACVQKRSKSVRFPQNWPHCHRHSLLS